MYGDLGLGKQLHQLSPSKGLWLDAKLGEGGSPSLLSVAVIKYRDQKQLGE